MKSSSKPPLLPRRGLARNMVVLLFGFGFVPLLILALIFFSFYFEGQKRVIRQVQKEIAERISLGISSYLEKTTNQIRLLAKLLNLEGKTRREVDYLCHSILDQWIDSDMITVMDLDGNEISKVSRHYTFSLSELGNRALDPSFGPALNGKTYIGRVGISAFSKFPHINITVPIMDLKERVTGVLAVEVNVSRMWELISKYRIGEDRYAYVVDSRGVLIAYQDISSVLQKRDLKDIEGVRQFLAGGSGVLEYEGLTREPVIGASAAIPLTGWGVFVEQPARAAYGDLYFLSAVFLAVFLATAAFAVVMGFRFSLKNVVRPLRHLQEEATLIAKGEFNRRIEMKGPDELGRLAESFNTMVGDLQKTVVSRDLLSREIEERKRTEQALREEKDRAQQYLNVAGVMLLALDSGGKVALINRKGCEILGWEEEHVLGKPWFDHFLPERMRAQVKRVFFALMAGEVEPAEYFENPVLTNSGEEKIVAWHNTVLRDEKGRIAGTLSSGENVTERKEAEEKLRRNEAMLAVTERLAHIGSWQGDNRSNTLEWSDETYRIFGREPSLGPPGREAFWKAVHPEDAPGFFGCVLALRSQGTPFRTELRIVRSEGDVRHVLAEGTAVKDGSGAVERIHGFVLDITERKLAEEALRESEEKYRDLVENIIEVIYSVDETGIVTYISPIIEQETGYTVPEIVGRPFTDFFYPEDLARVLRRFESIQGEDGEINEYRIVTKSGQIRWVRASSRPVIREGRFAGLRGSFADVTEMKRLEAQLRQAQKMEALGTMAGGIAHDFNNILGIIVGNTELAMLDIPESSPPYRNLTEVRKACLRARDLVREILSFSRMSEPERKPVGLGALVRNSLRLLRSSIPTSIEIRQRATCEKDTVLADPTQINQVLLNLCTNAAYAMREKGGILEIELSDHRVEGGAASPREELRPGDYLRLSVRDTGHGIDPAIMERIFDPYFTTKPVGEGTGLGLAVVHGIVKGHGGSISVENLAGKGTVFHVFLPRSEGDPEMKESEAGSLPGGRERILFVDDEKGIVAAFQPMLQRLGYRVVAKTSSAEALSVFRNAPGTFDLVITDQTMPEMTGEALAMALMEVRRDIPVILCTGFSEVIDEKKARAMGIKAFVMKPIGLGNLAKTVRGVLDGKR